MSKKVCLPAVLAANAPLAVAASLRVLRTVAPFDEQMGWTSSGEAMAQALASDDAAEGLAAFAEKRQPVWRGT